MQNNIKNTSSEKLEQKHSKFKERLSQKRNKKRQNLKEKNLVPLENLLHTERTSSKKFGNATLKNLKERNSEEKNEVLYVRKDPDTTRIDKKELDRKFVTNNRKYTKKKLVVGTNSGECEKSGTSGQQVKSPLPLSYAEVTKTARIEKEVNFSELYLNVLESETTTSSKMETAPPALCTNSSEYQNLSCSLVGLTKLKFFLSG